MNEKISVCMATYNGSKFLSIQMESILSQLSPTDEIIIVDDASQDSSIEVLHKYSDDRVHIYRNEGNLGIFASFEKALKISSGDIIFLSDQDDVWLQGKVQKVMDAFSSNPEVTLVTSDAKIIDEHDNVISLSFFKQRGRFKPGIIHNLIKNKYLGCALAFRRRMLEYFLPIPKRVPMHDMWFGSLNYLHGKSFYINQPLIAWRRHGKNASPSGDTSIFQKILWRWQLMQCLILHIINPSLLR